MTNTYFTPAVSRVLASVDQRGRVGSGSTATYNRMVRDGLIEPRGLGYAITVLGANSAPTKDERDSLTDLARG